VLPNSGHSTDQQMVGFGYEACAVMDRYPNNLAQAASVLYLKHGFNDVYTTPAYVQFMSVATFLCPQHAHEQ
jgi:serine/threonine-protein kinase